MTLRAVLDSLDDIPEAFKSEYIEKDGKFHLDIDDTLKVHPSVIPLANSLQNVKRERDAARTERDELKAKVKDLPEDFDRAEYDRLVEDENKRRTDPNYKPGGDEGLARQREQYEQRIANLAKEKDAVIAERDATIAALDGEIVGTTAEDSLTKALVKVGVAPEFLKASRSMLRNSVKVVKTDAGERRAVVEGDLGEMDVEAYVENWSKSDEGKPFIIKGQGSGAQGSGKGGATEVNPWKAETKNVTAQGAIVKADRAKAERMMKAAGVPQPQIDAVLRS